MNSQKITVETIRAMKSRGEKIAALTAYDFPMAKLLDETGVPLILVGDSLGMVVLGYPDTTHVTMAEMEHHVRAAARAKPKALLGADLPFKSYETIESAVANSKRLVAAGAEFVKAEGGREILPQIKAIISAGIPFWVILGMLPQHVLEEGGYHIKGKKEPEHQRLLEDAKILAGRGRVRDCSGTGHAAGRKRNFRNNFHSDHRHRQRDGLRRADFGDAGFGRAVSVVHAAIRETACQLRGGNQVSGGGVEKFRAIRQINFYFPANVCPAALSNSRMKFFALILILAVAAAGCTTRSQANSEARAAFFAGQNTALQQPTSGVTVIGQVQNPQVPWVEGLTLAQAIATANYLDSRAPKEIIITRQGENASVDPKVLLRGVAVPLEAGDIITLR